MTNDEAKFILQGYRPGGRDASDPAMETALRQAQADPELRAWFDREQRHATLMAERLRTIEPPPGLRDAILAGARFGVFRPPRRTRWRMTTTLSLAAALVALVAAGLWWGFAPVPGTTLDDFAVNYVARRFLLQSRQHDVAQLKAWLVAQGGPRPGPLPASLEQLRALGCRLVKFDGRDVSLLCFSRDGREFHVFVAKREEIKPARAPRLNALHESRGHAVMAWADATNYYVLVSNADASVVERLL